MSGTHESLLDIDLELTKLRLKDLRALARRSNIHSSWLSCSKSDLTSHLQTISTEWKRYVASLIDFDTVLEKGSEAVLQDWNMTGPKRKKRKLRGRNVDVAPSVDTTEDFKCAAKKALEACVHIIPSGSGVFISDTVVLTCAHCIDHDDDTDYADPSRLGRVKELVTPHGETFGGKCTAFDEELDLALVETLDSGPSNHTFLSVSHEEPHQIFAIGNPYDIDLETDLKDQPTGFTPFWFSGGEYESVTEKPAKQGLGRLKHSCWTYWGHSGCPLIAVQTEGGCEDSAQEPVLVGLHNSWDDRTAQRHGVPLEDIRMFLDNNLQSDE